MTRKLARVVLALVIVLDVVCLALLSAVVTGRLP